MATPVIVGTQNSNNDTAASSFTGSVTGSPTPGNGWLFLLATDGGITHDYTGTGFTELGQTNSGDCAFSAAYKDIVGGEGSTISVGLSASETAISRCFEISGVDFGGSKLPVRELSSGAGANATSPAITPAGGTDDYLYIVGMALDNLFRDITGAPSGFGNFGTAKSGASGGQVSLGWADQSTTSSSGLSSGSWTNSSDGWANMVIAIPPDSGGGPTFNVEWARNANGIILPQGY